MREPAFEKAPIDAKRTTAATILSQLTELRAAAAKLLSPEDNESFERDLAELVSRLRAAVTVKKSHDNNKTSSSAAAAA